MRSVCWFRLSPDSHKGNYYSCTEALIYALLLSGFSQTLFIVHTLHYMLHTVGQFQIRSFGTLFTFIILAILDCNTLVQTVSVIYVSDSS